MAIGWRCERMPRMCSRGIRSRVSPSTLLSTHEPSRYSYVGFRDHVLHEMDRQARTLRQAGILALRLASVHCVRLHRQERRGAHHAVAGGRIRGDGRERRGATLLQATGRTVYFAQERWLAPSRGGASRFSRNGGAPGAKCTVPRVERHCWITFVHACC